MKKKNIKNKKIAPWLLVTVSLLLHGCSSAPWAEETMQAGDLVENITQNEGLDENITQSGNGDKNAAVTIKLNEDITHIWNMYEYTDISDTDTSDEDDKEELTTELLMEKNLDTSVVTDPIETKGCTFVPPEDFEELPDMEGMYVSEHYPVDASTIYCTEKKMDISLQLMTEDTFTDHMKKELKKLYDSEVEIKVDTFEKITIDDFPAFKIICSYSYGDVKITQLEYIINADKSYIIIYSQTDDYDRMEEFKASAETIQIKK
ncbi:MAG: hypothetical protein K2K46_05180 [Lachnospiraceae bacterium]|nr:hypothetical protein [Lachnospiraceae bacterium]